MDYHKVLLHNVDRPTQTEQNIVLDLDETLIHCDHDDLLGRLSGVPRFRSRVFEISIMHNQQKYTYSVSRRPHLDEFIRFCFERFRLVCVYSAGTTEYVTEIVDQIFPPDMPPHVILSRPDCQANYGMTRKDLSKIRSLDSYLQGQLRDDNTFIIDDRTDVWELFPTNVVRIPSYEPMPTVDALSRDDICLQQLKWWLTSIEPTTDVRSIDKNGVFYKSISEYKSETYPTMFPRA